MPQPTPDDLKKLKKALSLTGTTFAEKCKLVFVSLFLIVSIFGLTFLEAAWKGMRAAQRAKRLQAFAARFEITPDEAEKLAKGYASFLRKDPLLLCNVRQKEDFENVDNFIRFFSLVTDQIQLRERLEQTALNLQALDQEGCDRVGRYAWFNGSLKETPDSELKSWVEQLMARRKILCDEINSAVDQARACKLV